MTEKSVTTKIGPFFLAMCLMTYFYIGTISLGISQFFRLVELRHLTVYCYTLLYVTSDA